jgi:hypothetical protein
MKTRLLSDQEREFLKAWLEKDEKHPLLRDLKYRIRKHHKRIEEDMTLIRAALEKMGIQ